MRVVSLAAPLIALAAMAGHALATGAQSSSLMTAAVKKGRSPLRFRVPRSPAGEKRVFDIRAPRSWKRQPGDRGFTINDDQGNFSARAEYIGDDYARLEITHSLHPGAPTSAERTARLFFQNGEVVVQRVQITGFENFMPKRDHATLTISGPNRFARAVGYLNEFLDGPRLVQGTQDR